MKNGAFLIALFSVAFLISCATGGAPRHRRIQLVRGGYSAESCHPFRSKPATRGVCASRGVRGHIYKNNATLRSIRHPSPTLVRA